MTHIIKLTAKDRCTVTKGSAPDIEINEEIKIPLNHKGELYIRKLFGNKGINVPKSPFHEGWTGTPQICLIHSGAVDEELRAKEEIGELHIDYVPPSPLYGKEINLSLCFGHRINEEGKFEVATDDGKLYECSKFFQPTAENNPLAIISTDVWQVTDTMVFSPRFVMQDYKFIRYLTTDEQVILANTIMAGRFRSSVSNVGQIFKDDPQILVDIRKHAHEGVPVENPTSVESETPSVDSKSKYDKVCMNFEIEDNMGYTNDGKFITAWLGDLRLWKSEEYTILHPGADGGFIYEASERVLQETPIPYGKIRDGRQHKLLLINPVLCNSDYKCISQPTEEVILKYGYSGGLIYNNLGLLSKYYDYLTRKDKALLGFILKGIIKQSLRKGYGDQVVPNRLLRLIRSHSYSNDMREHVKVLKQANCSWNTPLNTIDVLVASEPFIVMDIIKRVTENERKAI